MRPYIKLKDMTTGETVTLYGDYVCRSIGYVAKQNENTYKPGSSGYKYVHKIDRSRLRLDGAGRKNQMKKYLLLLLALCLLTAGCGNGQEAPTTEPPASEAPTIQETEPETTAPETTAPKTREVQVMGDRIPGDTVCCWRGGRPWRSRAMRGLWPRLRRGRSRAL